MSDREQRVLDALIEYDDNKGIEYPILAISEFFDFDNENIESFDKNIEEDYEALTAEEEKQVIKAFLEFAY